MIATINFLHSNLTTSFKHTASILYSVTFEDSNVINTIENLKQLHHNVENNISTGKHVGYTITLNDVIIVIETMDKLVSHYQTINKLSAIPSKLKLYDMETSIRQSVNDENIEMKIDTISERLTGKTDRKLTTHQRLKLEAESVGARDIGKKK